MAINLKSLVKGVGKTPPRILISGVEGIGKTTFAAYAPEPVFLMTDEGRGKLDITGWKINSFTEMMQGLESLAEEKHEFLTVVIDSVDWLEPLIHAEVSKLHNVDSIESIGYGKGYAFALDLWRDYLSALDYLCNEKNMMVIQIAHNQIKRYESPDSDSYDRYTLKLKDKASSMLMEHSDCVFFCNYKVFLKEDKNSPGKKGEKRNLAVGDSQRFVYTERKPSFDAKNRYNLPQEIIVADNKWGSVWNVLADNIPYFETLKG